MFLKHFWLCLTLILVYSSGRPSGFVDGFIELERTCLKNTAPCAQPDACVCMIDTKGKRILGHDKCTLLTSFEVKPAEFAEGSPLMCEVGKGCCCQSQAEATAKPCDDDQSVTTYCKAQKADMAMENFCFLFNPYTGKCGDTVCTALDHVGCTWDVANSLGPATCARPADCGFMGPKDLGTLHCDTSSKRCCCISAGEDCNKPASEVTSLFCPPGTPQEPCQPATTERITTSSSTEMNPHYEYQHYDEDDNGIGSRLSVSWPVTFISIFMGLFLVPCFL